MNIHANKQEAFVHNGISDNMFTQSAPSFFSPASQVDQLRSELMQERSARHDLEMDKSALERQVIW